MEQNTEKLKQADEAYLFDYVAGNLDDAEGLLIACHVSLNPNLQERIAQIENVCGSLLEDQSQKVPLSPDCFESILRKIDNQRINNNQIAVSGKTCSVLPKPLVTLLDKKVEEIVWQKLVSGIEYYPVLRGDKNSAFLLKVAPRTVISSHTHKKTEMTLLLQGGLKDEDMEFYRGDISIEYPKEKHFHTPIALGREECICLVTNLNEIKLENFWGRLVQPFIKVFR